MNKIRVGLIGCGAISPRHFEAIKQIPEFELKAVSDIDKNAAKKAGLEQKVDYYADNKKIFERKDIDLVSVCTPISTHTDISIQALKAGKYVLTEKPVGITLESIDRLIETGKKNREKDFCSAPG